MTTTGKIATIFGGTGFIGRHIVQRLAKAGYTVKVATRAPESAYFLKTCGAVGQIVPFACDYSAAGINAAVKNADLVINCIGLLFEKKRSTFKRAHVETPELIAQACAKTKARFIHISALGIEQAQSRYAQTKRDGETALLQAYPSAVIIRPSVVFGPEDNFFNMIARLAQLLPALLLVGGGKTKFQPVFVGDVADATMVVAARVESAGRVYELAGPEVVSLREIYEIVLTHTTLRRPLVSLPFCASKFIAAFLSLSPAPLLTQDQLISLKTDSVASGTLPGLKELGITPTSLELVVPSYLEAYRPGGRFADKKQA